MSGINVAGSLADLPTPAVTIGWPAPLFADRYVPLLSLPGGPAHLSLIDCHVPTAPVVAGTISTSAVVPYWHAKLTDTILCVSNGTLVDGQPLFQLWDLSTIATPALLAAPSGSGADQLSAMACVGSLLVGITLDLTRLVVWDCSIPAAPTLRGTLATSVAYNNAGPTVLALSSMHVLTMDGSDVIIVSLSNPDAPAIVGRLTIDRSVYAYGIGLLLSPTIAVLFFGDAFIVVDVSDPTTPAQLGSDVLLTGLDYNSCMGCSPPYILIGGDVSAGMSTAAAIEAFNAADPAAPVSLGVFSTAGEVGGDTIITGLTAVGDGRVLASPNAGSTAYVLSVFRTPTPAAGMRLFAFPFALTAGLFPQTIQLTRHGPGDAWTPGTPGSPAFALGNSGGAGATLESQTVLDGRHATVAITPGTTTGRVTVTDPDSGAAVQMPLWDLHTTAIVQS